MNTLGLLQSYQMCEFDVSLSITTLVSLLANEFDFRRVLHRQVSLAAVIRIYVFRGVMNICKTLKIH